VLQQCQPAEPIIDLPEPVLEGHGETILVVEDNPEVQAMIETQLRSAGFDVLIAGDGQQALDVLQEHTSTVRLALLDVDLPKMDGRTCLREIGVKFPHLPAVMMSGLSSVDQTQLATPFLRKPFDRSKLLSTIDVVLREAPFGQANGVLVIDDDESIRMSTEALLVSCDFDVFVAGDVAEAVAQLRDNLNRIGTILLDWNIPQTDPVATLRELRQVSKTVRVFAYSGDLSLDSHQVKEEGFSRLVRKPASGRELVDALTGAQHRSV
jgi:DNA-binding response OmpR family regulator